MHQHGKKSTRINSHRDRHISKSIAIRNHEAIKKAIGKTKHYYVPRRGACASRSGRAAPRGSLERPAAEDGVTLADVAGASFLEVVEDSFRVVRRAGGLDVHAKENDDGMKFKQRDNHVMGSCGARRMQAHNTHMCLEGGNIIVAHGRATQRR